MIDNKKGYVRYLLALLGVVLMFGYVFYQSRQTVSRLDRENEILVEQNVRSTTQLLESNMGFAESRIRVIANNLSSAIAGPELRYPKFVLSAYMQNSPFSFMEYVRADGINELADGTKLDARDRVYYIEGMKGKYGIWANFKPAVAKEVLLNYYAPLRFNNETIGVIVGVIGCDFGLKNSLKQDFFGENSYSIIFDSEGRVVTSNAGHSMGQSLEELLITKGLTKAELEEVRLQIGKSFKKTFKLERGDSYALVSFAGIGGTEFTLLELIPESSISSLRKAATGTYTGMYAALVLLAMLIFILFRDEYKIKSAMQEAKKELDLSNAISKMYHTLHVIDLENDSVEEYASTKDIRQISDQKLKASEKLFFTIDRLAKPEWKERVFSFVDLSTLQERLQDQESILMDFESVNVWTRAIFTVMERDERQRAIKVIFITRVIEKYMRDMERLHRRSNVDLLTGLLNRSAYEDKIKEYCQGELPNNFVVASIDLNNLKNINDTKGHAAGDESIKGAAECLLRCLGGYGEVYRIGGDEFNAIIFADEAKLKEIKRDLDETVRAWRGKRVEEIFLACGYASKAQHPYANLGQLCDIADKLMYTDKEYFYGKNGFDRRRRQYAFDVICNSYTKILRVNLTEDAYSIIRLEEGELKAADRPETISGWLESFGNSEQIYPEDMDKFLEATKLEKLREFFKQKQGNYSLYYRRKINGEFKYVVLDILVAPDYKDDNQVVYMLVKDIDGGTF